MIRLVYDCLKAPYDIANILQVVLATNACELHVSGNSLRLDHPKVVGKVGSWSAKVKKNGLPQIPAHYYPSLKECAEKLKSSGIRLIGTSPRAKKSFFDLDLSKDDYAIVFGTEVGGLSQEKASLMDEIVVVPMSGEIDFMTLSVITPIVVYEAIRQQKGGIIK